MNCWYTLSQIKGHIAMWAIRQSPYQWPDKLETVLSEFEKNARCLFDANQMRLIPPGELRLFLKKNLFCIREFMEWNVRRNGREGGFAFVTRYSKPSPDDDFIDLDALVMNVAQSLELENSTL